MNHQIRHARFPLRVRKLPWVTDYATGFPPRGGRVQLVAAFTITMALAGGSIAQEQAEDVWRKISGCTEIVDVEIFIVEFPESRFVDDALACLTSLRGSGANTSTGGREATLSQAIAPEAQEASLDLTLEQRALVQHGLVSLGYEVGIVDGIFGFWTRRGIASYQQAKGLPSTGFLTSEQSEGLMALGEGRDNLAWLDAQAANTHAAYRDYLSGFPRGIHSVEAKSRISRPSAERETVVAALLEELERDQVQSPRANADAGSLLATTTPGQLMNESSKELELAVKECWSVPNGVRDDSDFKVTLGVELDRDGRIKGSPRLVEPGSIATREIRQAFNAARRAVMRCQPYDLPVDKYEQWQSMNIEFDPRNSVEVAFNNSTKAMVMEAAEEPFTREEHVLVQQSLNALGFEAGPVDGDFGRRTRAAIRKWQSASGYEGTGQVTQEQFAALTAVEVAQEQDLEPRQEDAANQSGDGLVFDPETGPKCADGEHAEGLCWIEFSN